MGSLQASVCVYNLHPSHTPIHVLVCAFKLLMISVLHQLNQKITISLTASFLLFSYTFASYHQICLHTHIHTTLTHHTYTCTHTHVHINTIARPHFIVASADYTSVSMTLGPFTSQQPRQCFNVSITNDTIVESNETFTARLTLLPASVTTITANRITIDPPETTVQVTDNDLRKLSVVRVPRRSQVDMTSLAFLNNLHSMQRWIMQTLPSTPLFFTVAIKLVVNL